MTLSSITLLAAFALDVPLPILDTVLSTRLPSTNTITLGSPLIIIWSEYAYPPP